MKGKVVGYLLWWSDYSILRSALDLEQLVFCLFHHFCERSSAPICTQSWIPLESCLLPISLSSIPVCVGSSWCSQDLLVYISYIYPLSHISYRANVIVIHIGIDGNISIRCRSIVSLHLSSTFLSNHCRSLHVSLFHSSLLPYHSSIDTFHRHRGSSSAITS